MPSPSSSVPRRPGGRARLGRRTRAVGGGVVGTITALFAGGCGDATVASPNGTVDVTTAVAPAAFRAGDAVTVTVTLTNRTRRVVYVENVPCHDPFYVLGPGGTQLPPAPRVCDLALRAPAAVAPGDQLVLSRVWRGDVGAALTHPSVGTTAALLPPGTYAVLGFARRTDSGAPATGDPVSITVLASAPTP